MTAVEAIAAASAAGHQLTAMAGGALACQPPAQGALREALLQHKPEILWLLGSPPPLLVPVPADADPPAASSHTVEDPAGNLLWCVTAPPRARLVHRFYLHGLTGRRWCPVELNEAVTRHTTLSGLVGPPEALERQIQVALSPPAAPARLRVSEGRIAVCGSR